MGPNNLGSDNSHYPKSLFGWGKYCAYQWVVQSTRRRKQSPIINKSSWAFLWHRVTTIYSPATLVTNSVGRNGRFTGRRTLSLIRVVTFHPITGNSLRCAGFDGFASVSEAVWFHPSLGRVPIPQGQYQPKATFLPPQSLLRGFARVQSYSSRWSNSVKSPSSRPDTRNSWYVARHLSIVINFTIIFIDILS